MLALVMRGGFVVAVLAFGCGPVVAVDDGSSESSAAEASGTTGVTPSTTATSTSVGSSSSTGPSTSTTTSAEVTSSVDEDTGIVTTIGFICGGCGGDFGGVTIECDIWAQDCPDGEKCMPWANDGGRTWNATRCSPLGEPPNEPGDPCTVEGSGVSGIDSCALGSMCFGVDGTTNTGSCVAMCGNFEANPTCPEGTGCFIAFDGVMPICLPPCDPLAPDCGADTCVIDETSGNAWCIPAILVGETVQGERCDDAPFVCNSDFVCAPGDRVLDCVDETCCTTRCDPAMPTPCPNEALGELCIPLDADPTIGYCGVKA